MVGLSEIAVTTDESAAISQAWLRATDLKQWLYCPRIVYYGYCMPLTIRPTAAMQRGRDLHERIEFLERRRKLKAYCLDRGERQFEVPLVSRRYSLSGKLDMLISTSLGRFPADFKMSRGPAGENHRLQLAAYAIMIEEQFDCRVNTGFIYLIPHRNAEVIAIDEALRKKLLQSMAEMRIMIRNERFPEATPVRPRCWDCEFRHFCNDVF